ncbi:Lrp/AsnC family transcriptional regulator [Pseudomarimonas salicorniae]|uniref:Lrp/AsnC family transcriptional regulator n=1 Tax=Pseudomarimonas salicorniae TaxID=2933270 RepID=A0ABT0GEU8_9GAMM|nr:Lrp/AsnC family transcriptional regulator [Lysobacter sp. CAU 1642]MCK7592877.1 Lrp/AsnC family transcriptional regulator [Lysobacter sp. CAU 1642]
MPETLDRTDRRLLLALQGDARLTTAQLAERVALSPSPCWRRIKALESDGVIRGYHARLDATQLGWGVTAFVHIMLENHSRDLGERFEEAVRGIDRVIACHNVSGEYDYLLQVVARDLQDFGEFARDRLRSLPGVKEINSSLSLREVKSGPDLPVPDR